LLRRVRRPARQARAGQGPRGVVVRRNRLGGCAGVQRLHEVSPMNFSATHYQSGEEIRPGDRISWAGRSGTVLFVLGLPGVPVDWASPEDWLGEPNAEGFMLEVEGTG